MAFLSSAYSSKSSAYRFTMGLRRLKILTDLEKPTSFFNKAFNSFSMRVKVVKNTSEFFAIFKYSYFIVPSFKQLENRPFRSFPFVQASPRLPSKAGGLRQP